MTDANSSMLIFETSDWILKHRQDSKLPGYLILVSKNQRANSLSDLSDAELNVLGRLQAKATRILESCFGARLVYICRWGHQPGNTPHFHIVPLYAWIEEAYENDPLWQEPQPDGPILFTYITRAFIEYAVPPIIIGPSVKEVVSVLFNEFMKP